MNLLTILAGLGGSAALATALGSFFLWAIRNIIRQENAPLVEDISVLRVAVFNHLAHGETPEENKIRQFLTEDRRDRSGHRK